jgi:hypothetical protein
VSKHGYEFDPPLDASVYFQTLPQVEGGPSSEEVAAATTDVDCKLGAGPVETYRTALWKHRLAAEADHSDDIKAIRE